MTKVNFLLCRRLYILSFLIFSASGANLLDSGTSQITILLANVILLFTVVPLAPRLAEGPVALKRRISFILD